jgi:hypothetical protein
VLAGWRSTRAIPPSCWRAHWAYGPQPERGVFRTADGGKNWDKVLFVDENTACSATKTGIATSRFGNPSATEFLFATIPIRFPLAVR